MIRRIVAIVIAPLALLLMLAWATASQDPVALTKKTLTELEAKRGAAALSGSARGPSPLDAASHPIAESRRMLARAAELRSLGDTARAEIAEDAALEWALTARELVRAIELEQDGVSQAALAVSASAKAERARAMLEEAIARRATLEKTLDTLEKDAEARALDAGSGASAKPKPKGAP
jgi:hypothetical protein